MPKITYILPDGNHKTFELRDGQSVMEGAIRNGLSSILAECGGSAMCATCHVYIESGPEGAIVVANEDEAAMLEEVASPRMDNSRLSCQLRVSAIHDGMVVRVAEKM